MRSKSKHQWLASTLTLLVILSIVHVYAGVSVALPGLSRGIYATAGPQQVIAILTTRGNQPVSINGLTAISGATILSGATIETPDGVGATINLGSVATLDLAPNTKVIVEFDQNGKVKVLLINGCAILRTRKTTGEIVTSQGVAGRTDYKTDGVLDVCLMPGAATPTVNSGAAASAGVGAGGPATTATSVGTGGISATTVIVIASIGAGALITAWMLVPCRRGRNPTPGAPRGSNDCS